MVTINPETQKTRKERLATVITLGVSALIHILFIVGAVHFYRWVEEDQDRERLMVVRRVMDTSRETSPRPRPGAGSTVRPRPRNGTRRGG